MSKGQQQRLRRAPELRPKPRDCSSEGYAGLEEGTPGQVEGPPRQCLAPAGGDRGKLDGPWCQRKGPQRKGLVPEDKLKAVPQGGGSGFCLVLVFPLQVSPGSEIRFLALESQRPLFCELEHWSRKPAGPRARTGCLFPSPQQRSWDSS